MNILFVQEADWLKRNPHQQHHLAEMLSLKGHDIKIIDFELLWRDNSRKELYSKREVLNNISKIHTGAKVTLIRPSILKIPLLDYFSLLYSHRKEIRRQLEEFAPDVIIGFSILNSYLAMREARKRSVPFVYYWIDVLHRLIPIKALQPIGRIVESRILRHADRILAINDTLKDYMVGMGASPVRTQVLRAGVDTDRLHPIDDNSHIRRQYGIKENDIVLFFMGWLYNFSGLKEVALELTTTGNRNIKLLIVGEGDAYDELRKIREAHGLKESMMLLGRKPYEEIPELIAAADICLLPANPDETIMQDIVPIKMYEYMAMAKPVITTRLPGIMKEFGEDNGVVYVDKPEDVITKAVELSQNGDVNKLGLKARNFAIKNSWDNIADEFERIIEEAVKEKTGAVLQSIHR